MNHQDTEAKLLDETARVVEIAKAQGADTVVAAMQQKSEFLVEVRNGEIENLSEAEYRSVSITVSKGGRRATVSSCELTKDAIHALVEQALGMCQYTGQDDFYSLPDQDRLAFHEEDTLDMYDPNVAEIDVKEKIKRVMALENAVKATDPRLCMDSTSLSTITGTSVLANSLGFCRPKRRSYISLASAAFAEDEVGEGDLNTGRKQTAGWASRARHLEDLAPAEEIAANVSSRILRKLGARKLPSGKYPVYMEPSIASTLWGSLASAINGSQIYRDESYLVGRLNTQIASPLVTIVDDPSLPRGLGSRLFDAEGVLCEPMTLVEEGVLKTWLLGTYSARKLGMRGTAHAGGLSNVLIAPGEKSEEEMLAEMGTGIWITSLLGQGVNISTGGYSRGAHGLWVENGKVQHAIREFTVNSNLDQMFKNIIMVGNNVYKPAPIQTPGFVISEMSVGGT